MSIRGGVSSQDPTFDTPCEPWYEPDELMRGILRMVPPRAGHRVLIVHCAGEKPSARLAEETGADVVSVDVHAPDPCLPVAESSIDQVWCLGATTHVEDLPRFADEVMRVLRSGGRALVADTFWDGFRPPRFADRTDRPWHAMATKSVVTLLSRAGLTEAEVLPWPTTMPTAIDGAPQSLAADLADGRLSPALVTARKP